ncbi:MAG: molybdate ABC transporter substrate-binding protein [Acidobacteriales bacterium]|nr:molybdate ABC transporter substrate-binding protein [Terriglobales bacterium]
MSGLSRTLAALICAVLSAGSVNAQEVRVAAASDLRFVMPEIVKAFETTSGAKVTITYGASGTLFAQIQNGAPFDVFLSADMEYPKKLEEAGLALSGTLRSYAAGSLAVLYRRDLGFTREEVASNAIFLDARVKKIAIANPAHAPYGRAAIRYVLVPPLYEKVKDKLLLAENVAQATQFVESGNADVGIVSHSLAMAPGLRDSTTVGVLPHFLEPPLEQGGVILNRTTDKDAAKRFLGFLDSIEAKRILRSHGFAVVIPEDDKKIAQ